MSRRLIALSVALTLGLFVLAPGRSSAQAAKPESVTFETADFVDIKGTYWPSSKGKKGPVAILLHKSGSKSTEDGWKDLAEDLQKEGYAVLSFDFRGHGGSVNVNPNFWDMTHNKTLVRRRPGAMPPSTISPADFSPKYWPYLINDIAAAKRFLERRYNDQGDCNLSNTILIGAEDGATLGALWVASEAHRFRILATGNKNVAPESKDIVACIWLSMSQNLGPVGKGIPAGQVLRGWLKDAGNSRDSKVPMVFLYGKMDTTGDALALALARSINPTFQRGTPVVKKELEATGDKSIAGTKLQGAKLLTKELDTRNFIVQTYLPKLIFKEEKPMQEWEKRDAEKSPFVWDFGGPRGTYPCNPDNFNRPNVGRVPNVVPLAPLRLN